MQSYMVGVVKHLANIHNVVTNEAFEKHWQNSILDSNFRVVNAVNAVGH